MTPEQMSAVTLGEFEAMATRLEAAAKQIRDAMALLGGAPAAVAVPVAAPAPASKVPVRSVEWTPAELAERQRLARLARGPELPEDIERMES